MAKATKRLNPRVVNIVDRRHLELVLEVLPKILEEIPDPWEPNKLGRPGHHPKIVGGMLYLKEDGEHTYNSAESDVCRDTRMAKIFGVSKLPGHSVLHRGMQKLPLWWIALLNKKLTFRLRRAGTVIIDSTCFDTKNSSVWYDIRIRRDNKKKKFLKLHMAVCAKTGAILEFKITDGNANDSPQLRKLLKFLHFLIAICDKAYSNRTNCKFVAERKGILLSPPKSNATTKKKGCKEWKTLVKLFKSVWTSLIYHTRSLIESVNSSIKKRSGDFLRSIKKSIQKKELAFKVVSYNMRRMLYIKLAEMLGEDLWVYPTN